MTRGGAPLARAPLNAFHCDPDGTGNLEICVINADGTSLVRLTNDPAIDEYPAWSRDGTKIRAMGTPICS